MIPEVEFAVFLDRVNKRRVARERFVRSIPTALATSYDNETESYLLLIRAQTRLLKESSKWLIECSPTPTRSHPLPSGVMERRPLRI